MVGQKGKARVKGGLEGRWTGYSDREGPEAERRPW